MKGRIRLASSCRLQKVFWPSMVEDAQKYVRSCDVCQRFVNVQHLGGTGELIAGRAGRKMVAMDLFGKVKEPTARGNKFGFVMVDSYTKVVMAGCACRTRCLRRYCGR